MSLIQRLLAREFEFNLSMPQLVYYTLERRLAHLVLRRYPPNPRPPNLLNLGCGPHMYPGWVNADDYAPKRRLREREFKPDWTLDITRPWRCVDNYWDGIFTQHVVEHTTYAETGSAALVLRARAAKRALHLFGNSRVCRRHRSMIARHRLAPRPFTNGKAMPIRRSKRLQPTWLRPGTI
jgi:hypothetical protein